MLSKYTSITLPYELKINETETIELVSISGEGSRAHLTKDNCLGMLKACEPVKLRHAQKQHYPVAINFIQKSETKDMCVSIASPDKDNVCFINSDGKGILMPKDEFIKFLEIVQNHFLPELNLEHKKREMMMTFRRLASAPCKPCEPTSPKAVCDGDHGIINFCEICKG